MTLLTPQDSNVQDSLWLSFEGPLGPQPVLERALEPFFQAIEEYADEWMPDIDPARQLPLDVSLDVQPLSFFAETERCRKFMDMARAWASHYPVPHAMAHSMADLPAPFQAEMC